MRLFHTSDTHLGHQQYPRTGPDGLNVREGDIANAFHTIIDHAIDERPDAFLHAGDLFDGVRPGNRALAAAMEGFVRLSEAGIPTIVIAGNHEHPRMRGTGSPLRLFEHLPGIHAVYKGRAELIELGTDAGTLHVSAIPQCPDQATLAESVAACRRPEVPHALMLHGAVRALEAFSHAEFNEQVLEPGWFDERFDYVALGHFHGHRQVAHNAWYCGASERVSIAESGEEKGFIEAHVRHGGSKAGLRPLEGRPYLDLPRIDADGLDAQGLAQAATSALSRVPDGAVARLRLDDIDPALRGTLDLDQIRKAGARALHLDLRLAWKDRPGHQAGAIQLGALRDEWETFAARHPVEGVDRERILEMASRLLEDA